MPALPLWVRLVDWWDRTFLVVPHLVQGQPPQGQQMEVRPIHRAKELLAVEIQVLRVRHSCHRKRLVWVESVSQRPRLFELREHRGRILPQASLVGERRLVLCLP